MHRRAVLLSEMVDDPDALDALQVGDAGLVRQQLAAHLDDLGFTVDNLLVMIRYESDEAEWVKARGLRHLCDAAYESLRIKRAPTETTGKTLVQMQAEKIHKLLEENRTLRRENRTLHSRLRKIERNLISAI